MLAQRLRAERIEHLKRLIYGYHQLAHDAAKRGDVDRAQRLVNKRYRYEVEVVALEMRQEVASA